MSIAQMPIGGTGILKLAQKMSGVDREKLMGLLAPQRQPDPMQMAGSNIAQFQGGLNQDLAGANQFAGDLLAQRHGSLGGIENSMAATMASQGVGNRYSGQGMPNPGDWVPAPDGGRLVWSQAGMWERQ